MKRRQTSTKKRKKSRAVPKFFLHQVRLDRNGYDSAGRYYGVGAKLFEYESGDGTASYRFRANDSDAARAALVFNPKTRKVNGILETRIYGEPKVVHKIPEGDE